MAPEFLNSSSGEVDANVLLPSDIYSLAHLVYAVMEQHEPHENASLSQIVSSTMSGNPLTPTHSNWPKSWKKLVKQCWNCNPSQRPTIEEFCDIVL